jgi:hypothetical protein
MAEKPLHHGRDHRPGGEDPTETGEWIYVGTDPRVPFVNGANAGPTVAVPNPVPLRFRLSIGPPNELDTTGTSITLYTNHQVEIQGDIGGLAYGQTVFNIPLGYQHDYDVPYHSHDDVGGYVPCRLLSTGQFIYGVP